jgi:hypothetical protein
VLKTMVIDAGNEQRAPLSLVLSDRIWLTAYVAANVLPLVWWGRFEAWARQSLTLYAGR